MLRHKASQDLINNTHYNDKLEDAAYNLQLSSMLLQHLTTYEEDHREAAQEKRNSSLKRWLARRSEKKSHKMAGICKASLRYELEKALQMHVEQNGGVFPAPRLPPLLAMRCKVLHVDLQLEDHVQQMCKSHDIAKSPLREHAKVFVWMAHDGRLGVHTR
jgi:hypothetical protein